MSLNILKNSIIYVSNVRNYYTEYDHYTAKDGERQRKTAKNAERHRKTAKDVERRRNTAHI